MKGAKPMEHRKCPSCKKHWHSSEGQAIWKCECGAEMTKENEVEWKDVREKKNA